MGSLTGTLEFNADLKAVYDDVFTNLQKNLRAVPPNFAWNIVFGQGAGMADDFYNASLTVPIGGTILDFSNASLLNPNNETITWAFVRAIIFSIPNGQTEGLTIGGGATPVFASFPKILADDGLAQFNNVGWTVAAGTKFINIDATGNTVDVTLNALVIGEKVP